MRSAHGPHRQRASCRLEGRADANATDDVSRPGSCGELLLVAPARRSRDCCSSLTEPARNAYELPEGRARARHGRRARRRDRRGARRRPLLGRGARLDLLLAAGFFVAGARDARVLGRARARRHEPAARPRRGRRSARALLGGGADRASHRSRAADHRARARALGDDRSSLVVRRWSRSGCRCTASASAPARRSPATATGSRPLADRDLVPGPARAGRGGRLRPPLPRARRRPRQLARARRDARALRRAPLRAHSAASRATTSPRATSCACSPTASCSSASGGRSASPSSGARSPRSARGSRARSTTGSRSTCSRSRRTRACSRAGADRSRDPASAEGGRGGRAAGGAVRGARALLGRRHGAVRRGAAPVRRLPHRRRRSSTSSSRSTGRIRLAPDEQIEVFRIVQEGLANARKHAGARRAEVRIGRARGRADRDRRATTAPGSTRTRAAAGQGLKNMRARAASIGGGFRLVSAPGHGTALEVVLRA